MFKKKEVDITKPYPGWIIKTRNYLYYASGKTNQICVWLFVGSLILAVAMQACGFKVNEESQITAIDFWVLFVIFLLAVFAAKTLLIIGIEMCFISDNIEVKQLSVEQKTEISGILDKRSNPASAKVADYCAAVLASGRELFIVDYHLIKAYLEQEAIRLQQQDAMDRHRRADEKIMNQVKDRYEGKVLDKVINVDNASPQGLEF